MRSVARSRVIFLGLLWALIAVGGVVWGLDRLESDVGERSRAALDAAGFAEVELDVDGRDVIVLGAGEDEAAIDELLADVEGVRRVSFGGAALAEGGEQPEATVLGTVVERETTTTTTPPTTTTTTPPTTTTTTVPPAPTTLIPETMIEATLEGGQFRLSGVVPDEETAEALTRAANIAYFPFASTEIEVLPGAAPLPWLAGAPTGISLLPMISEGTIRVEGDRIELTGKSPNAEYLAAFEATVSSVFGIDDVTNAVEITNLAAPRFVAHRSGDTVRLSGELPSEEIRQIIVGGAVAAYGAESVVDETTVEDGLYTSFWMYTMPGVFQLARPFPDYELLVEDGVTTGALRGGASFDFDSAELTPQVQQLLGVGAAILSRDLSLGTLVTGHTDSVGPDHYNDALSQRRAQNAVDFLVESGIAPERLRAVGRGESEPLVPNDTEANRAINRRVEFIFGPVTELVG